MFGLNDGQYNVVKAQAKKCSAEISDLIAKGAKYDQVAAKAIDSAHEPIKPIITRLQFVWLIGYLNGRFTDKDYE